MKVWNQAKVAWMNTRDLPGVLQIFIRGGMIASLVLLVLTLFPLTSWTVDGRTTTYAQMWRSGGAELVVLWLLLMAAGCWGVALRKPNARWILIFSPFASLILNVGFASFRLTDVFVAIFLAAIIYAVLFHLRSVRLYFGSAL